MLHTLLHNAPKEKKIQNGKEFPELWERVRGSHKKRGKEVFDNKSRLMGYMKSLKYTYGESDNKNANSEWLMMEYSLYDGYLGAREIKNMGYVICKIKKKGKSTSDENMNDVEELIDSSLQLKKRHYCRGSTCYYGQRRRW
ncbi:hypothetical protein R3W88_020350 [Solanum pinnatisectum]|uniref:NAC domain-containing protein n=1 Tax=Solanum pinnatisectum TaxID=50273 RepID=A0AAV9KMG5_9SOLN|nr:hypothetical protein R3W88_020350 [Solanum pinnatisectum]